MIPCLCCCVTVHCYYCIWGSGWNRPCACVVWEPSEIALLMLLPSDGCRLSLTYSHISAAYGNAECPSLALTRTQYIKKISFSWCSAVAQVQHSNYLQSNHVNFIFLLLLFGIFLVLRVSLQSFRIKLCVSLTFVVIVLCYTFLSYSPFSAFLPKTWNISALNLCASFEACTWTTVI